MTKSKILLATALATLLVAPFAGCNGTSLDDGDSADVVLQIGTIQPTPITSTPSTADPTTCTFTAVAEGTGRVVQELQFLKRVSSNSK